MDCRAKEEISMYDLLMSDGYEFLAEAYVYFILGYRGRDTCIHKVKNEVYQPTGRGEEKVDSIHELLLAYQYRYYEFREELDYKIELIIDNDPNWK